MFHFVAAGTTARSGEKEERHSLRQHAIRIGIQNKKKELARRNDNFIEMQIDAHMGKPLRKSRKKQSFPVAKSLSAARLDPFDTLPGDGQQLRMLMAYGDNPAISTISTSLRRTGSTPVAVKPVVHVEKAAEVYLNGMSQLLQDALSDPSRFQALSLGLTLAACQNVSNLDILKHQGATLRNLRRRLVDADKVPSVSTLTAMLLLIGYEYRVNGPSSAGIATHIRAVNDVISLLGDNEYLVSDTLRRAVFWHDVYSCIFLGTPRQLSHRDFQISYGTSDTFNAEFRPKSRGFALPSGFVTLVPESSDLYHILIELDALYAMMDDKDSSRSTESWGLSVGNYQWILMSRAVDVLHSSRNSGPADDVFQACILATLLCVYKLWTVKWEGCFIPEYFATQIMGLVLRAKGDERWRQSKELLLWLLSVSGALSRQAPIRKRARSLIQFHFQDLLEGMYEDKERLENCLRKFIWCRSFMELL